MKKQHAHTLEAVFHHPLRHDLHMSDVEAMLVGLEAHVEHLSDHRLKLQLASGETMVLHAAAGKHHPLLDADGVLRLRRFLEEAGVTPEHADTPQPHPKGDQAKRLVIHLDHRGARLWWLVDESVETSSLHPHGLWSSHQRLSHRHDRDIAGQRAPLDHEFLQALRGAMIQADRVLVVGHGHGESDMRKTLYKFLEKHYPSDATRLEVCEADDTAWSDKELLAAAHKHFGNQAHRHHPAIPGKELD